MISVNWRMELSARISNGKARRNYFATKALRKRPDDRPSQEEASMRLLILIILILLLIGAFPTWPYSAGWGYYPVGGLGTILIVLLILALFGVI